LQEIEIKKGWIESKRKKKQIMEGKTSTNLIWASIGRDDEWALNLGKNRKENILAAGGTSN
jgi:hypothetical protein